MITGGSGECIRLSVGAGAVNIRVGLGDGTLKACLYCDYEDTLRLITEPVLIQGSRCRKRSLSANPAGSESWAVCFGPTLEHPEFLATSSDVTVVGYASLRQHSFRLGFLGPCSGDSAHGREHPKVGSNTCQPQPLH